MEGWPPGPHTPETSWFRDMRERGSQGAAAASPGPFTFTVPWVTLTKLCQGCGFPFPVLQSFPSRMSLGKCLRRPPASLSPSVGWDGDTSNRAHLAGSVRIK